MENPVNKWRLMSLGTSSISIRAIYTMAMLNNKRVLYMPIHIIIISHKIGWWIRPQLVDFMQLVVKYHYWLYPMIIPWRDPMISWKLQLYPPIFTEKHPHDGWSWLTTMNHFLTRMMSLLYGKYPHIPLLDLKYLYDIPMIFLLYSYE